MLNFSGISKKSFKGRLLRAFLFFVPGWVRLRVMQGPLAGAKWIKGSGVNGYWLGSYEAQKQKAFADMLKPGWVVYDLGANAGFYTLIASRRVGESGRVVAFEPAPKNIANLKKHIKINRAKNAAVEAVAVSDTNEEVKFDVYAGGAVGKISVTGIPVRAVRLDDFIREERLPPPDLMKIDVEGAEAAVLRGAENTLKEFKPVLFLATHSNSLRKECLEFLAALGAKAEPMTDSPDEFIVHW